MTSILSTTIVDDVFGAPMRAAIYSPNYGGDLLVVGKSYPKGSNVDDVVAGRIRPESVMLSSDGRHWLDGWHHGDEADAIYVERHMTGGCVFHGYVDSASRRIVQTG